MPGRGQSLAERLNSATVHLGRALKQGAGTKELSAELRSALASLVYGGPMAIGALAKLEGVSAPAMTKTVGLLQARGLVSKLRDKSDRRVVLVRATRGGIVSVLQRRHAQVERIRQALSSLELEAAQIEDTIRLLERLVSYLETK